VTEKTSETRREKDLMEAVLAERIAEGETHLEASRVAYKARLRTEIADLKARLAGMAHIQRMYSVRR